MTITDSIADKFVRHINTLTSHRQIESLAKIFALFEYGPYTDRVLAAFERRMEEIESLKESHYAMP